MQSGGGIFFDGSGTVESCSFLSNSADYVSDLDAVVRLFFLWRMRCFVPSATRADLVRFA